MGNLLLFVVAIFLSGLLYYTASPMPSGDRGVGYSFMLLIFGGGFLVVSGLLTWNLAATHRLDWLPALGGFRGWLVFFGWLAFFATVLFGSMFKTEWHQGELPEFLRWLAMARVASWLPVLMLGSAFWLLNFGEGGEASPPMFVKVSMKIGFVVCCVMAFGLLLGMLGIRFGSSEKPPQPLDSILRLTAAVQDSEVRRQAIADLKSRGNWENELWYRLKSKEQHSDVYFFLDGNRVPNPAIFVEPIKEDLRSMASEIRKRIGLGEWMEGWYFESYHIEECLRAIDLQFSDVEGGDFREAVRELRAALGTPQPEPSGNVQFAVTQVVDDWLKRHP